MPPGGGVGPTPPSGGEVAEGAARGEDAPAELGQERQCCEHGEQAAEGAGARVGARRELGGEGGEQAAAVAGAEAAEGPGVGASAGDLAGGGDRGAGEDRVAVADADLQADGRSRELEGRVPGGERPALGFALGGEQLDSGAGAAVAQDVDLERVALAARAQLECARRRQQAAEELAQGPGGLGGVEGQGEDRARAELPAAGQGRRLELGVGGDRQHPRVGARTHEGVGGDGRRLQPGGESCGARRERERAAAEAGAGRGQLAGEGLAQGLVGGVDGEHAGGGAEGAGEGSQRGVVFGADPHEEHAPLGGVEGVGLQRGEVALGVGVEAVGDRDQDPRPCAGGEASEAFEERGADVGPAAWRALGVGAERVGELGVLGGPAAEGGAGLGEGQGQDRVVGAERGPGERLDGGGVARAAEHAPRGVDDEGGAEGLGALAPRSAGDREQRLEGAVGVVALAEGVPRAEDHQRRAALDGLAQGGHRRGQGAGVDVGEEHRVGGRGELRGEGAGLELAELAAREAQRRADDPHPGLPLEADPGAGLVVAGVVAALDRQAGLDLGRRGQSWAAAEEHLRLGVRGQRPALPGRPAPRADGELDGGRRPGGHADPQAGAASAGDPARGFEVRDPRAPGEGELGSEAEQAAPALGHGAGAGVEVVTREAVADQDHVGAGVRAGRASQAEAEGRGAAVEGGGEGVAQAGAELLRRAQRERDFGFAADPDQADLDPGGQLGGPGAPAPSLGAGSGAGLRGVEDHPAGRETGRRRA